MRKGPVAARGKEKSAPEHFASRRRCAPRRAATNRRKNRAALSRVHRAIAMRCASGASTRGGGGSGREASRGGADAPLLVCGKKLDRSYEDPRAPTLVRPIVDGRPRVAVARTRAKRAAEGGGGAVAKRAAGGPMPPVKEMRRCGQVPAGATWAPV